MQKLRQALNKVMALASIFLFVFMVIVGTYQIVTRYFFNAPSTISEELLTYTFTWMALISASYVFGKRDHMRMAFFAERFSPAVQRVLAIASEVLILLFSIGVLCYGGVYIVSLTMTQQSASLGIPMGYIYAIVPICGVVTVLYNIINLYELAVQGRRTEERRG